MSQSLQAVSDTLSRSPQDWTEIAAVSSAIAAAAAFLAVIGSIIMWVLDRKAQRRERRASQVENILTGPCLQSCENFRREMAPLLASAQIAVCEAVTANRDVGAVDVIIRDAVSKFNEAYLAVRSAIAFRAPVVADAEQRADLFRALDDLQDDVVQALEMLGSTREESDLRSKLEAACSQLCGVLVAAARYE